MSEVADNLNAVADMVAEGKMWCKGEWSASTAAIYDDPEDRPERLGCAEGLLAERLGLYNGYIPVWGRSKDRFTEIGQVLNFHEDRDEEDEEFIKRLRQTEEWQTLAKILRKSGFFDEMGRPKHFAFEHTVIGWNDDDHVTEQDVIDMFHKAAIEAS